MIIRLEDLNRVSEAAFHEYLGLNDFTIVNTNVGREKPYHQLYEQFKQLPIPSSYLDGAYSTRYAAHFYTESEIRTFRNRWLHTAPNAGENGE
jgi:hypothetical protein